MQDWVFSMGLQSGLEAVRSMSDQAVGQYDGNFCVALK